MRVWCVMRGVGRVGGCRPGGPAGNQFPQGMQPTPSNPDHPPLYHQYNSQHCCQDTSSMFFEIYSLHLLLASLAIINSAPRVSPSLVHWTRPPRSPMTQVRIARPPSDTKEAPGVVRKNCCLCSPNTPGNLTIEFWNLFASSPQDIWAIYLQPLVYPISI